MKKDKRRLKVGVLGCGPRPYPHLAILHQVYPGGNATAQPPMAVPALRALVAIARSAETGERVLLSDVTRAV